MAELDGKVAVITGGTRGLGLAIARAYAAEGARVVVASRSVEAVDSAVNGLRADGAQAAGQVCDVADLAHVEALADFALKAYGRIDVWVNNAGVSAPYGPTIHVPPDDFVRTVQTDVFGTYYGSLIALRYFLPRRAGKLINVLGRGDREPVPFQNAYAASKAWIRNFTLALAKEYKKSGVGIFAFNPGMMRTDLLTRVDAVAGYESKLRALPTVMRMWAKPPEGPAERAVWLASPATDGRTGLEVRLLGPRGLVRGMVNEGLRVLRREPAEPIEMKVRSVPAAISLPSGKGAR